MRYLSIVATLLAFNAQATAQIPEPPRRGIPASGVLLIGHSQVNHQVPGYLDWIFDSAAAPRTVERQVIGGGNLEEAYVLHAQFSDVQDPLVDPDGRYLYWPGRLSTKGVDPLTEISTGNYGSIIVTEEHGLTQAQSRLPGFMTTHGVIFPPSEFVNPGGDAWLLNLFQPTHGIASGLGFYHQAVTQDASTLVYLYENFFPMVNGSTHCDRLTNNQATKTLDELNSWRRRILAYRPAWLGLAAEMNVLRGQLVSGFSYGSTVIPETTVASGSEVEVIPVAQALSVLSERACADQAGGLTNPNELFADHAHASEIGNYFVALVMYAVLTGQSPAGITLIGNGIGQGADGSNLAKPDAAISAALQDVAWQVGSGAAVAVDDAITICPDLRTVVLPEPQYCADPGDTEEIPDYNQLLIDGFESGDTGAWTTPQG